MTAPRWCARSDRDDRGRPRRYPTGRRCDECRAALSVYNAEPVCAPCAVRLRGDQLDALASGGRRGGLP